jgi:peptide/nickel transport system substrate-binding protein
MAGLGGGKLTRRSTLRILAGSAAGLAVACVPSGPTTSPQASTTPAPIAIRRGGTLRIATGSDPTALDPQLARSGSDLVFLWANHDPLIGADRRGVPRPEFSLAESWDTSNPTQIKVKLRQGITFHDGTPFDAEAVKWNIERVQDPKTASAARQDLLAISRVEIVDKSAVVLHLGSPNAAVLTALGDRGGLMTSPTAGKAEGANIARKPVGTGPFKFVEWVQSSRVVYERNPNYWRKDAKGGALPYLDRLQFQIIPEAQVRLAALESNTVDHVQSVAPADWDRLAAISSLVLTSKEGSNTGLVFLNTNLAPTNNVDFRRALNWAVDRTAMNRVLYQGKIGVAKTVLGTRLFGEEASVPDAAGLDLVKARAFLEQSGIPAAERRIKLFAQSDDPVRVQSAEFLQAEFKKIGVETQIVLAAVAQLLSDFFDKPTGGNMLVSGFGLRADPDGTMRNLFHSTGYFNPGHRANAEVDGLIDRAVASYDPAQRKDLYVQLERVVARDALTILYSNAQRRDASIKKMRNLETLFSPTTNPLFDEIWLGE